MAAPAEITAILQTLALAYPERKPDTATLAIYTEFLVDIPAHLLESAAKDHIRTSPWFPKIAELRLAAARLANTHNFETAAPTDPRLDELAGDVWPLVKAAQALEDAFYSDGRLDPAEWTALAAQFESLNHPHRAGHTREKLHRLQSIQAAAGRTPDPAPEPAVDRRFVGRPLPDPSPRFFTPET